MNNFVCYFLVFMLTLSACSTLKSEQSEIWWIDSARVDCEGVAPMTCYRIQPSDSLDPEDWTLLYSEIKGFNYEPGNFYRIKVRVIENPEPVAADASSKGYELVDVLSKKPDPALRLTNIWKVVMVDGRENPTIDDTGEPLVFEFNASQKTYFGNLGCNTTRGSIKTNDGDNLLFGPGATTMMACRDMSLEQTMSMALFNARSYIIKDRLLRFYDEAGEELITFQAVD